MATHYFVDKTQRRIMHSSHRPLTFLLYLPSFVIMMMMMIMGSLIPRCGLYGQDGFSFVTIGVMIRIGVSILNGRSIVRGLFFLLPDTTVGGGAR